MTSRGDERWRISLTLTGRTRYLTCSVHLGWLTAVTAAAAALLAIT